MEKDRHILLILFWGLILEIITLLYFIVRKRFPFEFYLNLILIGITILGIWLVLRKIRL
jgi:hypothetical protein